MKRTPLRPGTKGLARGKRLTRSRGRGRKCYARLRDPEYKAYVRSLPCLLFGRPGHECKGRVEFSHVQNEGNGGPDYANGLPLCSGAHRLDATSWHVMGKKSWQAHWDVDAVREAARYAVRYERATMALGRAIDATIQEMRSGALARRYDEAGQP